MRNGRIAALAGMALALVLAAPVAPAAPAVVQVAPSRVVIVGTPWFGWYASPWLYDPLYPHAAYPPVQIAPGNRFPVEFHVHPWKADLVLDGKNLGEVRQFGSTGFPLWLRPGGHRVELSYPGFRTLRTKIVAAPTMRQDFAFSLKEGEGVDSISPAREQSQE